MENFKKALKIAITEQVEVVRFTANEVPVLVQNSDERTISSLSPMSNMEVQNLIASLIPQGFEHGENLAKGQLSIVNYGELHLIASLKSPATLQVFIPPQGNSLFAKIWHSHQSSSPSGDRRTYLDETSDQLSQQPELNQTNTPRDPSSATLEEIQALEEQRRSENYESVANDPYLPSHQESLINSFGINSGEFGNQETENEDYISDGLPIHQHTSDTTKDAVMRGSETVAVAPEHQAHFRKTDYATEQVPSIHHDRPATIGNSNLTTENNDNTESSLQPEIHHFDRTQAQSEEQSTYEGNHYTKENPFKIHFGPTVPDEMIDPNQHQKIDEILKIMTEQNVSDLHLTQSQPPVFRIDGEISRVKSHSLSEETMEKLILPIMPKKNMLEFSINNDTDFAYTIPGLARFRVNVFRDINGVGAVIRQIPGRVLTAEELCLPPIIKELCTISKGLVIVTGPTGSGKSTTLAAMLDLINSSRSEHILTIEDPIEFVHEQKRCLINQREIHKHTESFSRALRAALREDPDVILIGEMRDLETVAIAIETAQTGHLVFGTLHTNTAVSTVDRLIDQFPADQQEQIRVMLADSLQGVICQTLIKKRTGGRCAAQEILIVDKAVSSLIREGNTHMIQNHMQTQKSKGNILLNEALIKLILKGDISIEDAYFKSVDKDALLTYAKQKGINLSQVS